LIAGLAMMMNSALVLAFIYCSSNFVYAFNVERIGLVASRKTASFSPLYMGWGGEVTWNEVEILSKEEAGKDLYTFSISIPEELAKDFNVPGQFVQIKVGENKPGFYAIASAPNAERREFEFLIKATENNQWLTTSKPTNIVEMSGVAGKGYDYNTHFEGDSENVNQAYDGFACMNIIFCAQGTGIAPIRSAIEHSIAVGLPQPATLYYGVQNAATRAYGDKFESWTNDYNVNVIEVHSKPEQNWSGPTGYVQESLKRNGVKVPRNAGAIICGNKDFFFDNKQLLLDAGLFEGRILTNF